MLPLIVSYLVLLWVLASVISRGQGFAFFAAGLAALGFGLVGFRRGRRKVLYGVYLAVLIGATLGLVFELVLRLAPGLLSGQVANVAYTGYHWQKGGIYGLDDHLGPTMLPGVRRATYWAGRWWRHQANADGYRGAAVVRADAVFLGDSMVYGHGVEEDQTVAARYAARTGLTVANLGQQGTCQVQSWIRLERLGLKLRPRVVFACSHFTDLGEATQWYAADELERLLASPQDAPYRPLARPQYRPRPWWDPPSLWATRLALPLRSSGVAGAAVRALRGQGSAMRPAGAAAWVAPSEAELAAPFTPLHQNATYEDALGWRVHVRSLRQIKRLCDAAGARLVLYDIGYPRAFTAAIEQVAQDLGALYSPAGRTALARAIEGRPIYLPNDGHWTPEGNDVVAAGLASSVSGGQAGSPER